MCKVYIGYHGTSEIEHGLCTCTVDNPLAKARGLSSLRTGAQTMLYLSHIIPTLSFSVILRILIIATKTNSSEIPAGDINVYRSLSINQIAQN